MKTKIFLVMMPLFCLIGGCSSSQYSILESQESGTEKTLSVQVPARTTKADMQEMGREIQDQEKVAGKSLLVKFFADWPSGKHTLMGTYANGVVAVYVDVH